MTDTAPLVLAFDTSGSYCAAVVMQGEAVLADRCIEMKRGQAEALFPLLEEVLAAANQTWETLDRIGVGVGPGNFTGIRISVASARGLALSLGIPAVGISSLEVQFAATPILASVPAPREQCYIQAFGLEQDEPVLVSQIEALEIASTLGVPLGKLPSPIELVREIAKRAATAISTRAPAPLYIRAADAAPPRDPAPVILP